MPQVDNTYKLRNQEFLQEYAQKPGVKIMFNGVMYREISKVTAPSLLLKVLLRYIMWENLSMERYSIRLRRDVLQHSDSMN